MSIRENEKLNNNNMLLTAGQFASLHNISKRTLHYYNDKEIYIMRCENGRYQNKSVLTEFFAAVHSAQAFSGSSLLMVLLSILNAFIFGVVAAEIVIITRSIIVMIIWHILFDFVNWISLVKEQRRLS